LRMKVRELCPVMVAPDMEHQARLRSCRKLTPRAFQLARAEELDRDLTVDDVRECCFSDGRSSDQDRSRDGIRHYFIIFVTTFVTHKVRSRDGIRHYFIIFVTTFVTHKVRHWFIMMRRDLRNAG
jgi:hypothetical protein